MTAPLVCVLLVGDERILLEFSGESAAQIRRALAASSVARRRQIERSVRGYRAEHGNDVSANQVVRVVGGNRQDVLAADRLVTGREPRERSNPSSGGSTPETLVPGPGNQKSEGES